MLVDRDIRQRELVRQRHEANCKGSTYYLTVGNIVPIDGNTNRSRVQVTDEFILEPQGMVWVVSQENISLPSSVTGFATLVTTLTKRGLLALNVGVIDPNWQGPIGTVLVNFSKNPQRVFSGERFFRIMFFEHARPDAVPFLKWEESEKSVKFFNDRRNQYVDEVKESALNTFPSSFLDSSNVADKVISRVFTLSRGRIAIIVAGLAAIIAFAQVLVPITASVAQEIGLLKNSSDP